ncbi:MAG: hypothetical protein AB1505_21565 [Candidatus Latescibacterota bacterium]
MKADDVLAMDLLPSWNRSSDVFLDSWYVAVHKRVAHLTYERVRVAPELRQWPLYEIAKRLKADLEQYYAEKARVRNAQQTPEAPYLVLLNWRLSESFHGVTDSMGLTYSGTTTHPESGPPLE